MKIRQYMSVTLGAFFIAFSVVVFLVPSKITSGGVSTLGTLALYFFSVPLSVTNIVVNAALFAFGFKFLKKETLVKTIWGIIFLTIFLEMCTLIPAYRGDMLVASLAGGVLLGTGLGLVVRAEGSTGGSDFAGIIIHEKLKHMSTASIIFVVDAVIIAFSGLIFGRIDVVIYSALSLFVATSVCDLFLSYGNAAKAVQIVSEKTEELSKKILADIKRGVTGIYCKGMYSKEGKLMLLCIVSPRQLPKLIGFVKEIDSKAFVSISDVREVLGEGFK